MHYAFWVKLNDMSDVMYKASSFILLLNMYIVDETVDKTEYFRYGTQQKLHKWQTTRKNIKKVELVVLMKQKRSKERI